MSEKLVRKIYVSMVCISIYAMSLRLCTPLFQNHSAMCDRIPTRILLSKPLHAARFLAENPERVDVFFSFPDGAKLGANKTLLAISCDAFKVMFSGDWKEEEVGFLPDILVASVNIIFRLSIFPTPSRTCSRFLLRFSTRRK